MEEAEAAAATTSGLMLGHVSSTALYTTTTMLYVDASTLLFSTATSPGNAKLTVYTCSASAGVDRPGPG